MKTWFWIRWFLIFECVNTAQRNFRLVIDDVSIKIFDTDLIEKFDCQVFQINNRSFVNCQVLVKRHIGRLNAHSALDFWRSNGQAMKLYDTRLDACSFMDSVHKNRFFNIYARALKKYSNLKCPLKPVSKLVIFKIGKIQIKINLFRRITHIFWINSIWMSRTFLHLSLLEHSDARPNFSSTTVWAKALVLQSVEKLNRGVQLLVKPLLDRL